MHLFLPLPGLMTRVLVRACVTSNTEDLSLCATKPCILNAQAECDEVEI